MSAKACNCDRYREALERITKVTDRCVEGEECALAIARTALDATARPKCPKCWGVGWLPGCLGRRPCPAGCTPQAAPGTPRGTGGTTT